MDTKEAVYRFMLDYQHRKGAPPTLDEIQANVEGLNYRSSAKAAVKSLVAKGLVIVINDPGSSRRYRAVEEPVGRQVAARTMPDELVSYVL